MTKYAITGISNGKRKICAQNYIYTVKGDAEKMLQKILNNPNNNPQTVKDCMGEDLEVHPVECYENGQYKSIYIS